MVKIKKLSQHFAKSADLTMAPKLIMQKLLRSRIQLSQLKKGRGWSSFPIQLTAEELG